MSDMHTALLVKDGAITKIEIPAEVSAGVAKMQEIIGNGFTTAFRVHLPGGLSIDGYCDDEFLLKDPAIEEWNVVLESGTLRDEEDGYPIGGPLIILGGNNRTGASRSLTEVEMTRFALDHTEGALVVNRVTEEKKFIPTLRYCDPAYENAVMANAIAFAELVKRVQREDQEKRDAAPNN